VENTALSKQEHRVPFIVNWQGKIAPKKSEALVSQIDLLATLAKLTEVGIFAKRNTDSRDQLEAWLEKDDKGRDYIIGSADV
jgi:arylsulfatase A-like enzyme